MKDHKLIIDIGSTTTKALLIKKENTLEIVGYEISPTTVEKPYEDVKIGIYNSIKKLEDKHNISILQNSCTLNSFILNDNISFLLTSSAGGGLQILVVGLTMSDSASSAMRAAYGVGGVLLNTIAIDDNRTDIERLLIIDSVHPDIILFCGGIDNGALFSIYRLAELLKTSNSIQKFNSNAKMPLIYAGNSAAKDYITTVFSDKFDTHIVPNLRPELKVENLQPTKEKAHELFLNNVMEHAPGYASLKKITDVDIIPTPAGVLNTLKILGKKYNNIFAFDIGGATTDIFSFVLDSYNRSVSANYGMSYSIGNVLKDSCFETDYAHYLNNSDKDYFENYIANKILYPTSNPSTELDLFIEHIVAIKSIKMSIEQHLKMHFNEKKTFISDTFGVVFKKGTVYRSLFDWRKSFKLSDIRLFIGSGGVISHATKEQALFIMTESLNLSGITEIWRDKQFIAPHLGVLSIYDYQTAKDLIYSECYEKLAVYIRYKKVKIIIENEIIYIKSNSYFCKSFDHDKKIIIYLEKKRQDLILPKDVMIVVDTRNRNNNNRSVDAYHRTNDNNNGKMANIDTTESYIKFSLPFPGEIKVKIGETVTPATLLGINKFPPPRIFVLTISVMLKQTFTESEIECGLLISIGDTVQVNQKIFRNPLVNENDTDSYKNNPQFYGAKISFMQLKTSEFAISPNRGIVDSICYKTGTIVLKEIQDYPFKPIVISIIDVLNNKYYGYNYLKPKKLESILKQKNGDFVYEGASLVSYFDGSKVISLESPYTGTIQNIDHNKGTISICYDKKPYELYSQAYGIVDSIKDNKEVVIKSETINIEGEIGFGKDVDGYFCDYSMRDLKDKIIYKSSITKYEIIEELINANIKGLVCETISYKILKRFLGKDIGIAITGNEEIPFSIIILQGFSHIEINHDAKCFRNLLNKYVLLKPQTQIRAGVIRPRVIVFRI